jgi:hypothetical protein
VEVKAVQGEVLKRPLIILLCLSCYFMPVLADESPDPTVVVVPGEHTVHMGVRPGDWPFNWYNNDVQRVFVLVMNRTGVISGINWSGTGNDITIGTWYKATWAGLAGYTTTTEGSSGGDVGGWKYPASLEIGEKNGTYWNQWNWGWAAFPSPNTGIPNSWYDPSYLSSYPSRDMLYVNLSIPGHAPVEKNTSFLVTPIACGKLGCHSGHIGSTAVCSSDYCDVGGGMAECAKCHGNIWLAFWGTGYKTVHPHEVEAHRTGLNCSSCHIYQLHGVHNSTALGAGLDDRCTNCHGNLAFPDFSGSAMTVSDTIGSYRPSYASDRENVKTYLMNKSNSSAFSLTLDWMDPGVDLDLYVFNSSGALTGYSATSGKPEVYTGTPSAGIYIIKVIYYLDFEYFPWIPDSSAPEDFNLTTDQGYPFLEKPIIDRTGPSWNCSRCHPLAGSPFKSVQEWESYRPNGSYSHADVNGDGGQDVECRFCHNPLHNVTVRDCSDCHADKQKHNAVVNCTVCHGQSTGHTPQYFNGTGGYTSNRSLAGSCPTCHQASYMDGTLNQSHLTAPKLPSSLNHSNGSKWGSYWTLQGESCLYCHGDVYHNLTPLGRASAAEQAWDYKNGSINATSTWCKDCHYGGSPDYMGGLLTPVPPEISNGSWYGRPGYLNHSLPDYNDSRCFGCHGGSLSMDAGMDAFMHGVSPGMSGGKDCTGCHDLGGPQSQVNVSAMSSSIHADLNNDTGTSLDRENQRCWACHGNGSEPDYNPGGYDNHPPNYKSPWDCPDCHGPGTGNYSAPMVSQHTPTGSITTGVPCETCHVKGVLQSGDATVPSPKANVSHYGTGTNLLINGSPSTDCTACHLDSLGTAQQWYADAKWLPNTSHLDTAGDVSVCWRCHGTPTSTFHDPDIRPISWYDGCTQSGCHV